ncbi:MAG: hypothetical protein JNM20_11025 [Rhizobiales bacterium]|nr:hypothetical protein [Hyphomicrobiales bacterium]
MAQTSAIIAEMLIKTGQEDKAKEFSVLAAGATAAFVGLTPEQNVKVSNGNIELSEKLQTSLGEYQFATGLKKTGTIDFGTLESLSGYSTQQITQDAIQLPQ